MRPWNTISAETAFHHPLFSIEKRLIGRNEERRNVVAIASDDWVHVIPLLPDGRVVLVRQWRYATSDFHLEFPGGVVDEGRARAAAERELAEETGYRAHHWEELGSVEPNPAILDNRLTVFLATGLEEIPEPERPPADDDEEIELVTVDPDSLPGRIAAGEIRHALMLSSYLLWDLHRRAER